MKTTTIELTEYQLGVLWYALRGRHDTLTTELDHPNEMVRHLAKRQLIGVNDILLLIEQNIEELAK